VPISAFDDSQKGNIRRFLGISALYKDLDTRLEQQLNDLPTRDPDSADQVAAILAKLLQNDVNIDDAANYNLDLAGAETASFRGPEQIEALQDYGRTLINQIAITFMMAGELPFDYYSSAKGNGGRLSLG
jgi:hypothetical protein